MDITAPCLDSLQVLAKLVATLFTTAVVLDRHTGVLHQGTGGDIKVWIWVWVHDR